MGGRSSAVGGPYGDRERRPGTRLQPPQGLGSQHLPCLHGILIPGPGPPGWCGPSSLPETEEVPAGASSELEARPGEYERTGRQRHQGSGPIDPKGGLCPQSRRLPGPTSAVPARVTSASPAGWGEGSTSRTHLPLCSPRSSIREGRRARGTYRTRLGVGGEAAA